MTKPYEYGGEEFEEVQYGHRFDCANEPGHEDHALYDDANRVCSWDRKEMGDPHRITRINNHPVVVVKRTITYGPWTDD